MNTAPKSRILPVVIVSLFLLVGLRTVSLVFGVSSAEAQTLEIDETTEPVLLAQADEMDAAPAPAIYNERSVSDVERRILERLAARRAALDAREQDLKTRETIIAASEARLQEKLEQFEEERVALRSLQEQRDEAASEDVEALVSAYERMKPKDAAAIFNDLEPDILIAVASGMRTQALSGVLAEMTPENARTLTRYLAERNKPAAADLALID